MWGGVRGVLDEPTLEFSRFIQSIPIIGWIFKLQPVFAKFLVTTQTLFFMLFQG